MINFSLNGNLESLQFPNCFVNFLIKFLKKMSFLKVGETFANSHNHVNIDIQVRNDDILFKVRALCAIQKHAKSGCIGSFKGFSLIFMQYEHQFRNCDTYDVFVPIVLPLLRTYDINSAFVWSLKANLEFVMCCLLMSETQKRNTKYLYYISYLVIEGKN